MSSTQGVVGSGTKSLLTCTPDDMKLRGHARSSARASRSRKTSDCTCVDVIGPFVQAKDAGTGKLCRYALLATVPIPVPEGHQDPPVADVRGLEGASSAGKWGLVATQARR